MWSRSFLLLDKTMFELITWQNVLTTHQSYTYQGLDRYLEGYNLLHIYFKSVDTLRDTPWPQLASSKLNTLHIISYRFLRSILIIYRNRSAIHIFASPFESPIIVLLIFLANLIGIRYYLISEPYTTLKYGYHSRKPKTIDSIKHYIRPYLYKIYAIAVISRVAGIFTISSRSYHQYLHLGLPKKKLIPFGYFFYQNPSIYNPSDNFTTQNHKTHSNRSSPHFRIIYVGSSALRKGISQFISTLHPLLPKLQLDLYGDEGLTDYSNATNVTYAGQIPFGDASKIIANYDFLALPSLYDGWGFVVSESLAASTPVIVSKECGSSVLISNSLAGYVFDHSNPNALLQWLNVILTNPHQYEELKCGVKDMNNSITSDAAGCYMAEFLLNVRPKSSATLRLLSLLKP